MAAITTKLTGILVKANGEYLADKEIKASAVDRPQFVTQGAITYVLDSDVATVTSSTGEFSIDLVSGSTLRLEVPAVGYDRVVLIPNTGPVDFMSLEDLNE